MTQVPIRDHLHAHAMRAHADQVAAVEASLGRPTENLRTSWLDRAIAIERGEAIGVYWILIHDYLTPAQRALGGRWIVQEDGELLRDLPLSS